ncbi:hypothetical protein [Chitinimonas koreensis]|uniref:hypothetical protein n=1 Tax=Chitinimonas koreensis TaxID=356302 RepID=UPI00041F99D6|nr:hypothetical protein [Chitinimonas koreensis]QNM94962.1 hypothetical protein H9L41_13660 [Chitinimonas koreensis]
MADLNAVRNFSSSMSQSLHESVRLVMNDVQANVNRLDNKKQAISQAGLERVQQANQTSSMMAKQRSKIDVYV